MVQPSAETLAQVLQRTCDVHGFALAELWAPRLTPNGTAVLELLETSTKVLTDESASERKFAEMSMQIQFASGYGLPGRVWELGQPEFLSDITNIAPTSWFLRGQIAEELGFQSALGIPILVPGNMQAAAFVVVFISRAPAEPSASMMRELGEAMAPIAKSAQAHLEQCNWEMHAGAACTASASERQLAAGESRTSAGLA